MDDFGTSLRRFAEAATPPEFRPFVDALRDTALYLLEDHKIISALIEAARAGNRDAFIRRCRTPDGPVTDADILWQRFRDVIAREG